MWCGGVIQSFNAEGRQCSGERMGFCPFGWTPIFGQTPPPIFFGSLPSNRDDMLASHDMQQPFIVDTGHTVPDVPGFTCWEASS